MRFESHWLGDAVAVPSCGTDDREDASFESLGARSWVGVDGRSNHVDPDPIAVARQDWRDTAINLALAGSGAERAAITAACGCRYQDRANRFRWLARMGHLGPFRSSPNCGRQCFANARSAASQRPGR
jgi:hypothetical protein